MLLNTRLHLRVPYSPTSHHPKPVPSTFQAHALLPLPRELLARRAQPPLRHVASPAAEEETGEEEGDDEDLDPASAAAVAAAIRRASSASPVRFRRVRRGEAEEPHGEEALAEPSADFRRLCAEQLEMFRVVVSCDAVLSMEVITEFGAVVLPMVKHPFVVGFLVAELQELQAMNSHTADVQYGTFMDKSADITPYTKFEAWDFHTSDDEVKNYSQDLPKQDIIPKSSGMIAPPQSSVPERDQSAPKDSTSKNDVSDHSAKKPSDSNAAPKSGQAFKETSKSKIPTVPDLNVPETTAASGTPASAETEEPSLVFERMPGPSYEYPIGPDENNALTPIHRVVKEGIAEEAPARSVYHVGKFAIAGFDESTEQAELKTFEEYTEKAYHSFQAEETIKTQRNTKLETELSKAEGIFKKAVDELNKFQNSFKEVEKLKEEYKAKAATLEAEKSEAEKRLRGSKRAYELLQKKFIEGFNEDLSDDQCEALVTEAQKTATVLADQIELDPLPKV
ncbi:hypothetical protein PR202_gb00090 [Eleusine coracana subsp. coracana]|uniref:Uncharacterized protein n=1 Tax=Eleusine coracana subsp. coracana TaxID=191504 RepID=A0AAV5DSR5_ELECO|nr:hypothetical protein PR202_gb00090 [Eleusine coracana subsp. coracana]